ncbi:hypothetical protein [Arcobacter roscoffensis]|uniref:Uncharacterized protein n=1 Tax=Arcobacter roscoffensis TaxID=2961520 RepID=A0ABY5E8T2_9BACT|nr:hypothetical protein [Arcobacter roscoffensis]UTJ07558.1 hypothetical protein NJU99_05520 [Arcobacter roscoffensis]
MTSEISNYFHAFKNKTLEADEIYAKCGKTILEFEQKFKETLSFEEYENNFLVILGYTYRLTDVSQRLYYTFQEAVYAIDLDKLMRNEDSLKLNTIVYTLVLANILKEYESKQIDEDIKQKAILEYKKLEERKAKENSKYHMYQN